MLLLLLISALISLCTSAPRPNASVWTNWSNRVESVGNEKDIVLRNFQITAGYYGLSLDFAALLQASADSGDSFALNWPTLAAWASNSVCVLCFFLFFCFFWSLLVDAGGISWGMLWVIGGSFD